MPPIGQHFINETLSNLRTIGKRIQAKLNSSFLNKAVEQIREITLNVYKNDSEAITEMTDVFNTDPPAVDDVFNTDPPAVDDVFSTNNLTTVLDTVFTNNTNLPDGKFRPHKVLGLPAAMIITVFFVFILVIWCKRRNWKEPENSGFGIQVEAQPSQAAQQPVQKRKRDDEGNFPSTSQGTQKKQTPKLHHKKRAAEVPLNNVDYSRLQPKIYVSNGNQEIELIELGKTLVKYTTRENLNMVQDVEVHEQGTVYKRAHKLRKYKSDYHLLDAVNKACGIDKIEVIPEENEDNEHEIEVIPKEKQQDEENEIKVITEGKKQDGEDEIEVISEEVLPLQSTSSTSLLDEYFPFKAEHMLK